MCLSRLSSIADWYKIRSIFEKTYSYEQVNNENWNAIKHI